MKMFILAMSLIALFVATAAGQVALSADQYRVYDAKGNPATIDDVIKALANNDVVFLGEQHDDAVGHAFQAEVFKRAVAQYMNERTMALSMEMFERDVQIVVDEYLNGLITEAQFLSSSRPWGNYKWDYKPLVELAKEKRLPVIAANAPRRYVNMVSRNGRTSLNALSKTAKKWIAPLPYGEPTDAYAKKFKALMGPSGEAQMGLDNILASQTLWDATMANSVAKFLKDHKKPLVVHLNGGFHTEDRLGTVDQLFKYRSKTKVLVVTMQYEDDFKKFDPTKHTGKGDFVVLTDAKQPRSKR
jgi:uncharacterized iron-regulated protein